MTLTMSVLLGAAAGAAYVEWRHARHPGLLPLPTPVPITDTPAPTTAATEIVVTEPLVPLPDDANAAHSEATPLSSALSGTPPPPVASSEEPAGGEEVSQPAEEPDLVSPSEIFEKPEADPI
jgi:hypothetical protein